MSRASGLTKFLAVLLGLVSVPVTAGAVVASVLWLDGGSLTAEPTRSVAVGIAPQVDVHLEAGILEIRRGAPGRVVLAEHNTVHGLSRPAVLAVLDKLAGTIRTTKSGASIDVPSGFPDLHLSFAMATGQQRDVTVTVPPDASLHVNSGPGAIRLIGLSGPVDISMRGGFLELRDFKVTGVSKLRVPEGVIGGSLTMAGGSVDCALVTGAVDLKVANPFGVRLQASAANGSVTVPATFALATTKLGSSSSVSGVIGGGQPSGAGQLTLETVNGGIAISSP
ncbi:MAG TPA: hypothetical protein VF137_10620 [Candidatus Dormibacteraeota bacterium]